MFVGIKGGDGSGRDMSIGERKRIWDKGNGSFKRIKDQIKEEKGGGSEYRKRAIKTVNEKKGVICLQCPLILAEK